MLGCPPRGQKVYRGEVVVIASRTALVSSVQFNSRFNQSRSGFPTITQGRWLEPKFCRVWTPNGPYVTSSAMWKRASIFVSVCFIGLLLWWTW